MNVYDFDKTIYDGDSTIDFYFFCLKTFPILIIYMPKQIYYFFLYLTRVYRKVEFKEKFYIFLKGINDIDHVIDIFWRRHKSKIKNWYIKQKQPTDIIISASPEFLLTPIGSKLAVQIIASKVDKTNGKYYSENCYGKVKVERFFSEVGKCTIDKFY